MHICDAYIGRLFSAWMFLQVLLCCLCPAGAGPQPYHLHVCIDHKTTVYFIATAQQQGPELIHSSRRYKLAIRELTLAFAPTRLALGLKAICSPVQQPSYSMLPCREALIAAFFCAA